MTQAQLDVEAETAALLKRLPHLDRGSFRVTSPTCREYNCAAWAAEETSRKWDPTAVGLDGRLLPPYFWPLEVPVLPSTLALEEAYATIGYRSCADGELVRGIQKIAIYGNGKGEWFHVARQLTDGTWTSKMADWADVVHSDPAAIEGLTIGRVEAFMERRCPQRALLPATTQLLIPARI